MVRKEGEFCIFKNIFLFLLLFSGILHFSSALSMTPALISIDFQPNFKQTFDYTIAGTKPDTTYLIYVKGDLAEYAILNKEELKGNGNFKVSLSLPSSLEVPGMRTLYVGVKEIADKELVQGTIGTAIELRGSIYIFVPYPGKYAEISFSSTNANVGDSVQFIINLINRGEENLTVNPRIEIFSNQTGEKKETLLFEERFMESAQKLSVYKMLNTSFYNPGRYKGVAIVEYGGNSPATAETLFRIGNLSIEIKNYTQRVILDGKIQKFNIDIESGWNDKIDGVYASVSFLNGTSEILSFETSSTSLNPWEVKPITGYFDTLNFPEGIYDANINLFYYGKDVGKSSSKTVQVEFIKESSIVPMIVLISLGIIFLIGAIILIVFLRRKKSPHRK